MCVFRVMTQEEMELIHERLEKIRKLGQREAGFLRLARNQLVEEDRATQSWRRQLEEKREQSLSRSRSRSRSRPPSSPGKLCYSKALDKVAFYSSFPVGRFGLVVAMSMDMSP